MSIEETLGKLLNEFNAKAAELRALDSELFASRQRLNDFVKREAEAQQAFTKINTALEEAKSELAEAQRAASRTRSTTAGERDRILSEAHVEAARIVEDVQKAVDAIRRKPAA